MIKPGKKVKIDRCRTGHRSIQSDTIPVELMLTIFLNNQPVSTVSCLPDDEIELVIGYLLNNCYIKDYQDINLLRLCEKQVKNKDMLSMSVMVETCCSKQLPESIYPLETKFIAPGCGSFDDMILEKIGACGPIKKPARHSVCLTDVVILGLSNKTIDNQDLKNEFGGLHSAALFDWEGNCIHVIEDIGRHNCIDKLAGYMVTKKINPEAKILFTTGRISLDIIFKVYMMRIPVIVSNSSITHSAIFLAKKTGITSIGYARGGRFNIYSHPSCITSILNKT